MYIYTNYTKIDAVEGWYNTTTGIILQSIIHTNSLHACWSHERGRGGGGGHKCSKSTNLSPSTYWPHQYTAVNAIQPPVHFVVIRYAALKPTLCTTCIHLEAHGLIWYIVCNNVVLLQIQWGNRSQRRRMEMRFYPHDAFPLVDVGVMKKSMSHEWVGWMSSSVN